MQLKESKQLYSLNAKLIIDILLIKQKKLELI